ARLRLVSESKTIRPVIAYDFDRDGEETIACIVACPPGSLCVLSAALAIAFSGPSPPPSPPCCPANTASATTRTDRPTTIRLRRRRRLGGPPSVDPGVIPARKVPERYRLGTDPRRRCVIPPPGFEPGTLGLEVRRSI